MVPLQYEYTDKHDQRSRSRQYIELYREVDHKAFTLRVTNVGVPRRPHFLRGALGGGGSSGRSPPPPDDVPEDVLPVPPRRSEDEDELDDVDDFGRPGIAMEKVWPSFRL
jgi:hypothetical protein